MLRKEGGRSQRSAVTTTIVVTGCLAALCVSFILTPLIYDASAGWVKSFAVNHYGNAMAGLAAFLWGLLVLAATFAASAGLLITILNVCAVKIIDFFGPR